MGRADSLLLIQPLGQLGAKPGRIGDFSVMSIRYQ
jgi:hypothetical protein